MAKVYKLSDKIKLKVDDVVVEISPLSLEHKAELFKLMSEGQNGDPLAVLKGSAFALKCGVKGISGLSNADGSPWEPSFDESGRLSDDTVEDLMNLELSPELIAVCSQLISGIPSQLPPGVEWDNKASDVKKKKAPQK